MVAQKETALATLDRLVSVNERRLAAGDIAEAALIQSRVEAQQFHAEMLAARGNLRAAEVALAQLLGARAGWSGIEASGELRAGPPAVNPAALLARLDERPDVRAAAARVKVAERQIASEKAKRVADITLGFG